MRVTLYKCDRCGLVFAADEPPDTCPHCRRYHSGKVTIRLAGQNIEVEAVRLYGENPLKKAAAGLENLRLGIRCPHNYIADYLCPECN